MNEASRCPKRQIGATRKIMRNAQGKARTVVQQNKRHAHETQHQTTLAWTFLLQCSLPTVPSQLLIQHQRSCWHWETWTQAWGRHGPIPEGGGIGFNRRSVPGTTLAAKSRSTASHAFFELPLLLLGLSAIFAEKAL